MPLEWNVYSSRGTLVAKVAEEMMAAPLVAMLGEGATVKYGRLVCWREGQSGTAADSYDDFAYVCANVVHLEETRATLAKSDAFRAAGDEQNAFRLRKFVSNHAWRCRICQTVINTWAEQFR